MSGDFDRILASRSATSPTRDIPKALPCFGCSRMHEANEECPQANTAAPLEGKIKHPKGDHSYGVTFDSECSVCQEYARESLIKNPPHYTRGRIECWDYIVDQGLNFLRGNVIKYVTRSGHKSKEEEIVDLQKARAYLDREIARLRDGR